MYGEIIPWIKNRNSAFQQLGRDDWLAIHEFSMMWMFFESRALGCRGNLDQIKTFVETKLDQLNDATPYQDSLDHFRERYTTDGSINDRFEKLRFGEGHRQLQFKHLVTEVLTSSNPAPKATVKALLFIAYRLRNNLFHGEKEAYGIADQKENFTYAAHAMKASLTSAGI